MPLNNRKVPHAICVREVKHLGERSGRYGANKFIFIYKCMKQTCTSGLGNQGRKQVARGSKTYTTRGATRVIKNPEIHPEGRTTVF